MKIKDTILDAEPFGIPEMDAFCVQGIHFTVDGKPHGKGRPRFIRNTGHAYTPPKDKEYEELVRSSFRAQCGCQ